MCILLKQQSLKGQDITETVFLKPFLIRNTVWLTSQHGLNITLFSYKFCLLTTSEFPLLLKSCLIALCGQAVLICSAFPSLLSRVRSEFQSSKLEGGKKGGITAFSLSLGSLVNGALLLN